MSETYSRSDLIKLIKKFHEIFFGSDSETKLGEVFDLKTMREASKVIEEEENYDT